MSVLVEQQGPVLIITLNRPEKRNALGLVAAGGGIRQLPRRIPLAVALQMGLTGASIDATRTLGVGLINSVVPAGQVLDEAMRLANEIAANAPLAVRFTKQHMWAAAEGGDDEDTERFFEDIRPIFNSADAKEGARAFAERRDPVWTGR